jgi:hypothetical protein
MKNTLLIFAFLLFSIIAQSVIPAPYCHSKPIFTTLPLTIGEITTTDISNVFTGYNLDIYIKGNSTIASVPPKL